MAEQIPLVLIDGAVQQLPSGDTISGASSSGGLTPEEEKALKNYSVAMAIALG